MAWREKGKLKRSKKGFFTRLSIFWLFLARISWSVSEDKKFFTRFIRSHTPRLWLLVSFYLACSRRLDCGRSEKRRAALGSAGGPFSRDFSFARAPQTERLEQANFILRQHQCTLACDPSLARARACRPAVSHTKLEPSLQRGSKRRFQLLQLSCSGKSTLSILIVC